MALPDEFLYQGQKSSGENQFKLCPKNFIYNSENRFLHVEIDSKDFFQC